MTAPPFSLRKARALALVAIVQALLLATPAVGAEEATKGDVKVSTDGGYVRLAFRFEKPVSADVQASFPVMVLTFKKPIALNVDRLNASAPDYISAARLDPDGTSIRIALARKVKVNTIAAAERFYVDLLPENWSGIMPGLPPDVIQELASRALEAERLLRQQRVTAKSQKPASIRVKVASQPTFTRYIFTMPDTTNVVPERGEGKLTLEFDQPIKWDLADARVVLPPTLASIDAEVGYDSAVVTFALKGTPKVRTFREENSIVVDVDRDGAAKPAEAQGTPQSAAAAPAAAASTERPAIAAPETVPAQGAAASEPPPKTVAAPPAAPAAPPAPKPAEASPPPAKASEAAAPAAPAPPAQQAAKSGAPERQRPIPSRDAPVVVGLQQTGEALQLEFPFTLPTPAAVFERADTLWLVFDSTAKLEIGALSGDTGRAIRNAVLERSADGAAVIRVKLGRPRLVGLQADGPGWVVTISDNITARTRPLVIARNIVGKNRASIAIPFDAPQKLHVLSDRDAGDRLLVITALEPTRGLLKPQNFVELRALTSAHGVVLQPLADDITAELAADKILVTRPEGLSLSPMAISQTQQLSKEFRALSFDTQQWGYDRQAPFSARQAELIQQAAMAPAVKRRQARLNLARFYLAQQMASEAKAVLDVMLSDKKNSDDVTGTVLRAVAEIMLERPDDALKDLSDPQVGNQLDAPIWRAIAYAREGKWPEASSSFKNVDNAISALPIELQRLALRNALRTAIEVHDFGGADRIVNEFETIGVPAEMEPTIAVLIGRLNEALGRSEDALTNYRAAANSNDRRAAAQGRLREIVMRYASGDMPRKDAIIALETVTTIWRGDETEAEGLKLLAHLYTEENRYRDAFHVMRTALLAHPNSELTRQIQDEAAVTFESLFLGGKGDALPPVEALGLFYDYRNLTPIGRRGDEMIRRLSDRLISVDLLDQAAELLQHQVDHRLQGAARAQVATRLAVIYLMNRKPDRALAALQATRAAELSNELRDQRLLLEARALSEIGRHDVALELIAGIDSREAMRLRSDILWSARRWRAAAEQIELLYGDRWKQFTPLNETERFDVLRAAIGYALGQEPIGLARFRERYLPKMADTPDRRAFDVVSAPVGSGGADFQEIAKKVAGVNSLDAFLREMRTRYPDTSAMSQGAEKATAPANAPAPPAATKPDAAAPKPDARPTGSIGAR